MQPMEPSNEETALAPLAAGLGAGSGTFTQSEGLTTTQAEERLLKDGLNVLDVAETESFLSIFLTQAKNIIFLLTFIASTITYMMGDHVKAYVLICIVVFVCSINAVGEWSGQDPGKALREQMGQEKIRVLRDGREVHVEVQNLVIGDVVMLSMGDMVPADMVVKHSVDLRTNEAVLTGEPTEQLKTLEPKGHNDAFPSNLMYSGTSVVSGDGKGEIVATGMKTQVGIIAKRLKGGEEVPLNPLQRSINFLGMVIGFICIGVICVATSVSFFTGYQNPMTPCPDDDGLCLLMSSAARGLIMAVSIIPHGLPFVVMVMLRVGQYEMSTRNGLVTRRTSVDYLGAISVICTDKTGTLTQGKMTAQALVGLCRREGQEEGEDVTAEFYPLAGLSPNGGVFQSAKLSAEAKRRMNEKFDIEQTRQVFAEPNLTDLSQPEEGEAATFDSQMVQAHLAGGFLNCHSTKLLKDDDGHWITQGNMTEAAVKVAAAKGGLWDADEGAQEQALRQAHPRLVNLEVPFTSGRKMMATVHSLPDNHRLASLQFKSGSTHCALLKGAPDRLLPKLKAVLSVGSDGTPCLNGAKISAQERQKVEQQNGNLANRALRSLLVAVCPLSDAQFNTLKDMSSADDRLEFLLDSTDLCFLSLWGIFDPPRAAVPGSIRECHEAGIRVVMITGDQKPTAMAIGKEVGIIQENMMAEECASLCNVLQVQKKTAYMCPVDQKAKLTPETWDQLEASQTIKPSQEENVMATASRRRSSDGGPMGKQMTVHDVEEKALQESVYRDAQDLAELAERVSVWARAQPTDKVTLVEALQYAGHLTAMTGDGVNDAPALKKAHAGVAMGISGTSVTKAASDLILQDDNFSTIVAAIREGRRIYANTQKYVTFNLSVKAGECMCLMSAILFGVPMPIRGLQLLLNLVCTHILPPLSLAWEQPEAYVMQVPPRQVEGDLVVSRVMWLFRWLPFIICLPCCVMSCLFIGVWSNTGFIQGNALIGSSRVTAVLEGQVACEFAGVLEEGRMLEDAMPFHCVCYSRNGNPLASPTRVEQWGRTGEEQDLPHVFDPWTGSTGTLYDVENTPWSVGTSALLVPCVDRRGVERWCWRDEQPPAEGRPMLPAGQNCAAWGAQLGQSGAYVVIHLGEILTLLTFRTDAFFLQNMFSNPVYTGFLIFNLSMLVFFIYGIPATLQLAPLGPVRLGISVLFACLLVVLNELVKIVYRERMGESNAALKKVALKRSLGMSPTYPTTEEKEQPVV